MISGSALLRGYCYDLDLTGHRTAVTETEGSLAAPVNRRKVTYDYDRDEAGNATVARVHRLTQEKLFTPDGAAAWTAAGIIAHVYDRVGNRTKRTATGVTSAEPLNNQNFTFDKRDQIDSDGDPETTSNRYDANGNTIIDENGTATGDVYDAENHLVQRVAGGRTIEIGYDHEGNRVSKTGDAGTTLYLLDDRNPSGYVQVLAEYSDGYYG